jgi:hypothetical protein
MSHSGRRAIAETAATLSGGSSCNKGKDKKKTSKKPGVKPKPTTSAKKRSGGGYGHGHKQKGGNCGGPYEFTHKQANILLVASDMDPNLKDLNEKVMNAILESLGSDASDQEKLVKVRLETDEKSLLEKLVFSQQNQTLASILQKIKNKNSTNATINAATQKSMMNQLEIRLNRYNFMNGLREEHLTQLQRELDGLRTELKKQDKKCTSLQSNPATTHLPNGGQKSSFLTR